MKNWNVKEYGVLSNTQVLQTQKIQKVIDMCYQDGGGEIIIPEGQYYVGSLRLYSNITLHLLENAHIYGSKNYLDYTYFDVPTTLKYVHNYHYIKKWNLPEYYIYGIICAFEEENISIIGEKGSLINGQDCFDENGEEKFRGPMGIIFSKCRNINLKGYTFMNSANWSHQMDSCQNINIENVTILAGHDGFNVHHCTNVKISRCHLETGDDCLAGYDIKNFYVQECYMNTACNSMRIGGSDIIIDNCIFEGPGHYPHISESTYHTHSLLKYYAIGADEIKQEGSILIKNCKIRGISKLLSYQYGNMDMMQDNKPLRKLCFENVDIIDIDKTSVFKGNGEDCLLAFKDCCITLKSKELFIDTDEFVYIEYENTKIKEI